MRRAGAVLLVLILGSCTVTRGSGVIASETRAVGAFSAIDVSSAFSVEVTVGGDQSVTLTGDDNLLELVRTRVVGSTLVIDTEPGTSILGGDVTAIVTLSTLEGLEVSGSGSISASSIDSDTVSMNVSGSGSIVAAGTAKNLLASISGSGSVDGERLTVENADVEISGSGSMVLAVSNALRATVSGSGSVEYIGDPAVLTDISGSGDVNRR